MSIESSRFAASGIGRFLKSGSDGRRSRDLTIFSRALYQLSYRAWAAPRKRAGPHRRTPLRKKGRTPATLTGLEPATSAVTGRRANQLRYRAKRLAGARL